MNGVYKIFVYILQNRKNYTQMLFVKAVKSLWQIVDYIACNKALLSQIVCSKVASYQNADACAVGMYLHGLAGDLAANDLADS